MDIILEQNLNEEENFPEKDRASASTERKNDFKKAKKQKEIEEIKKIRKKDSTKLKTAKNKAEHKAQLRATRHEKIDEE